MALSFHPDGKTLRPNSLKCYAHRSADGVLFIDMDGYFIHFPQARDFCDVIEHLLIIQESFENGFSLENNILDVPNNL